MTLPKTSLLALTLVLAAPLASAQQSVAAAAGDPVALIVSYRARPDQRTRLRIVVASDVIPLLNGWKQQGVFASYRVLFTAFASNGPDMFLILRFTHFTDLGRWEAIEKTQPGGLPPTVAPLAEITSSEIADILNDKTSAPTTPDSQFFVLEYDVLTTPPRYTSYVQGYVVPQFDAWIKSGTLVSYSSFLNQNPPGAPWSSFILLEYKDLAGLAARETVKNSTRATLAATDPTWKKWSEDKTAIRTEKAAIPALSLP